LPEAPSRQGWTLNRATDADMDALMRWFPDSESVRIWGGPRFRYPFTRKSFLRDCHWGKMHSFCLRGADRSMLGFGQIYERIGRINMARLVVHPQSRGEGAGRKLIELLFEAGRNLYSLDEYSLFVYRDNLAALKCYQSMGFEIRDYPPKAPLADECYYLTRPVDGL